GKQLHKRAALLAALLVYENLRFCSEKLRAPDDNLRGRIAESAVERCNIGLIAGSRNRRHRREAAGCPHFPGPIVQQAHEKLHIGLLATGDAHVESTYLGYHLIVDGEPLA